MRTRTYRVTAELEHAADGVPDDGTPEVSHVHFLGDVRAGEVHDHPGLLNLWRRWSILPEQKRHVKKNQVPGVEGSLLYFTNLSLLNVSP